MSTIGAHLRSFHVRTPRKSVSGNALQKIGARRGIPLFFVSQKNRGIPRLAPIFPHLLVRSADNYESMIGTRLLHSEITHHVGSGGMGDVYQATDAKLGRIVAIKLLSEEFTNDSERVTRLEREARVLASLNHPNIAAIHGLEHTPDRNFLVMEFVPGETLAERIAQGAIPIAEAVDIATQIAEALEEAHEKGVVHRDLKPANVKITAEGRVKVLDFGLAKAFEAEKAAPALSNSPTRSIGATQNGVILGTAAYMSPEQAKGRMVDR